MTEGFYLLSFVSSQPRTMATSLLPTSPAKNRPSHRQLALRHRKVVVWNWSKKRRPPNKMTKLPHQPSNVVIAIVNESWPDSRIKTFLQHFCKWIFFFLQFSSYYFSVFCSGFFCVCVSTSCSNSSIRFSLIKKNMNKSLGYEMLFCFGVVWVASGCFFFWSADRLDGTNEGSEISTEKGKDAHVRQYERIGCDQSKKRIGFDLFQEGKKIIIRLFAEKDFTRSAHVEAGLSGAFIRSSLKSDDRLAGLQLLLGKVPQILLRWFRSQTGSSPFRMLVGLSFHSI